MSTWLVVTGGPVEAQYDTTIPRPPLREGVLEGWLARQPEYSFSADLWEGAALTAEVHQSRHDAALIQVSFSVSRRGTGESEAEFGDLRRRLTELAALLGGRVWDDDEEAFVEDE